MIRHEQELPGPPRSSSRWYSRVKPFSYGTVEKASSGSTSCRLGTRFVSGLLAPNVFTCGTKDLGKRRTWSVDTLPRGAGSHGVLQVLPSAHGVKLSELFALHTPADHPLQVDRVTLVQPNETANRQHHQFNWTWPSVSCVTECVLTRSAPRSCWSPGFQSSCGRSHVRSPDRKNNLMNAWMFTQTIQYFFFFTYVGQRLVPRLLRDRWHQVTCQHLRFRIGFQGKLFFFGVVVWRVLSIISTNWAVAPSGASRDSKQLM